MNCSIIYYISYKTGYIQRVFGKKFKNNDEINFVSTLAAVSVEDMYEKFTQSLEKSDLIFVVGGLSGGENRNVITVLSDYFTEQGMDVDFNKKIVNPCGGKDGNLIKSGSKYIAILPDDPSHINSMVGNELMKNIDITESVKVNIQEQTEALPIVFAPEHDDTIEKLTGKHKSNILLKVCIAVGIVIVVAAAVWSGIQFSHF